MVSNQAQGNSGTDERKPLTLDSLIEDVGKVNPEILAARERIEELKAKIPVAGSLPDPELELEGVNEGERKITFGEEPDSMVSIKLSQEFPVAGKRGLRGKIAEIEVEQSLELYRGIERKVVANLKSNYYDLQAVYKTMEIISKNKDLLENLAQTAEARYAVGQGLQQDVLKAQVEITTLIQRLTQLEQQKQTSAAAINVLLNRTPESPLENPEDISKEKPLLPMDGLEGLTLRNSPAIRLAERAVKKGESSLELARKEYYPDIKVSVSYQNRGMLDAMYSLGFMIPLPVYSKSKQNYQVKEATSGLKAANHDLQASKQEALFKVKEQIYILKASDRVLELLKTRTIPQASLTLESSTAAYRVGKVDFLTLLNNLLTLYNLELEYYQEMNNFNKALARLEAVVGVRSAK